MEESILILGAGVMQRPAIQTAKNLGLRVFVVDANPSAPCVGEADVFEPIDLKDFEGIARYALNLKESAGLKAVFTAGTDFSASVAYASEKCGFPTHSFAAAKNATNKALMRQCFMNAGVPSPRFLEIKKHSLKETLSPQFLESLVYPQVVKPVDNMGARGCRMVRNEEELFSALASAFEFSRSETAILEEFIEGPEFSIDALVYDGTLTITGFATRHIFFPPYFIELGHTMPSQIPYEDYIALVRTFAHGIKSLGLSYGAAKADIKLTKAGPVVGEIAARLSGGYMSGWTFPYSSGLNLTEQAILLALGKTPQSLEERRFPLDEHEPFEIFAYNSQTVCAERAWISIPGKIEKILNLDEAEKIEGVKNIFPIAASGDEVSFPKSNVEKCGNIISVAQTRAEAEKIAQEAVCKIMLVLEKENPATEEFLFGARDVDGASFPPRAYQLPKGASSELAYELDCNSEKIIPKNDAVEKYIPAKLFSFLEMRDWNNLTLLETIRKFDSMCPNHADLHYKKFWTALLRGGVQGALYVAQ